MIHEKDTSVSRLDDESLVYSAFTLSIYEMAFNDQLFNDAKFV